MSKYAIIANIIYIYMLNKVAQKTALNIARKTLEEYFAKRDYLPTDEETKVLAHSGGVFVTLWKTDELRGCIGFYESDLPLAKSIKEMALAAAFKDNRFPPLTRDELAEIKIEISVLSPMKKISDINDIELGTHGVYVERRKLNGLFLPQVAPDNNWDVTTLLNTLCIEKAGLEAGCWRDSKTSLYTFTAQIFEE
jgi:uncharacterized protein